ncbi:MAG: hypothetical protein DMG88_22000, partial [Acidobacteria bacterium]
MGQSHRLGQADLRLLEMARPVIVIKAQKGKKADGRADQNVRSPVIVEIGYRERLPECVTGHTQRHPDKTVSSVVANPVGLVVDRARENIQ